MYAITGITGQVGSAVAEILKKNRQPIRAIIRNKAKAQQWIDEGVEVAMAELSDADALAAAFKGTEGIFIMTPPLFDSHDPMGDHEQMLIALSEATKIAKVKKVVYLSSIGAQHNYGTGAIKKLFDMETTFRQLQVPCVAIRAGWFMENFIGGIDNARRTGTMQSFINPTNLAVPMISTADIGKLAAELLLSKWDGRRIIELEGPCKYSADDVATVLSYHLKKNIDASAIAERDYPMVYESFGFTPEASALMAEMNIGFNSKHIDFTEAGVEKRKGETLLKDALGKYIK